MLTKLAARVLRPVLLPIVQEAFAEQNRLQAKALSDALAGPARLSTPIGKTAPSLTSNGWTPPRAGY